MLLKLKITKPTEYFAKIGLDGIPLTTCFVMSSVAGDIESIVSNTVADKSWVDVVVRLLSTRSILTSF